MYIIHSSDFNESYETSANTCTQIFLLCNKFSVLGLLAKISVSLK